MDVSVENEHRMRKQTRTELDKCISQLAGVIKVVYAAHETESDDLTDNCLLMALDDLARGQENIAVACGYTSATRSHLKLRAMEE